MAAVARRFPLSSGLGERLLSSKLQILTGAGNRRPSAALSILTGRADHLSIVGDEPEPLSPTRRQYAARTVYLAEGHVRDIDHIIEILSRQQVTPVRLNRSAVLRRAVEYLRATVEADPAKFMLENEPPHA